MSEMPSKEVPAFLMRKEFMRDGSVCRRGERLEILAKTKRQSGEGASERECGQRARAEGARSRIPSGTMGVRARTIKVRTSGFFIYYRASHGAVRVGALQVTRKEPTRVCPRRLKVA